jgi:recombinational DNA repair ATPase RecF
VPVGSAKEDLERFVHWLHKPETHAAENVRRFGNLVLAHFEEVLGTARQHNNRATLLAALARQGLATTPSTIPEIPGDQVRNDWPFTRLKSLTVGPFRGFRRKETFDLRKRIVLVYGPNGSGKTSLCDALEYGLLGQVQDAELKRLEQHQYLANIHARRFSAPQLTALDHRAREVVVLANASAFRFCFVERNRIDAFARIASRPPSVRTELIATLFGMEQFSEFVNHFNDSLDPVLVLTPENERRLVDRRQSLARDQQTIAGEQSALLRQDEVEANFAENCRPGTTYANLKAHVGSPESGRLHELEEALNAVPPSLLGITRQGLLDRYEAADQAADRHQATERQLEQRASQVAFKDLYGAILALQATEGQHCPACETPIENVTINPFEKATTGIQELRELSVLQDEAARQLDELREAGRRLRSALATLLTFLEAHHLGNSSALRYLNSLPATPRHDRWWQDVYAPEPIPDVEGPTLDDLLEIAQQIESHDQIARDQLTARQRMIDERRELLEWQQSIRNHDLQRVRIIEDVAAARNRIAEFDAANAILLEQVQRESNQLERDRPIKDTYDEFLRMLRRFRNELPGVLMAGLNELSRDLYNEFNEQDHEGDKLASLNLPLTGDQRISIAFRGDPQRSVDALTVLSEGHIRCLGLAILLAKCVSIHSPLIVFDDAVNAIDHDHRSGIRQAIFESDRFREMQLIVTCHSNEFLKDIQNNLAQDSRSDSAEYIFRHHTGDHHPRISSNETTRNYIARARAAAEILDHREALSISRKGLEMLSVKVWKWLGYFDRGSLVIEIDRPNGEPSLRNLCDAIRCKLDDATFSHANRAPVLAALQRILGIPAQNLIWTYLNKGTHEEENREDFDAGLVEVVVQTLEQMDVLSFRRP